LEAKKTRIFVAVIEENLVGFIPLVLYVMEVVEKLNISLLRIPVKAASRTDVMAATVPL
jgi:hypothetical protein